jgi:hypothetical protein
VIAEITNATWKFMIFDRMAPESAASAVREIVKAFEELVPVSVLEIARSRSQLNCDIPPMMFLSGFGRAKQLTTCHCR